jgi:hypothetical protein
VGDPGADGNPVLTDMTDTFNLGQDATHPHGTDFNAEFQVDGVEGATGPDDTAATAHDLGDLTQTDGVQVEGAIGDDPAYDPTTPLWNAAADVDLYHFRISGPGLYEVGAEVFAGRIGSTLDAGVSLFRLDPGKSAHPLQFVASNDDSRNDTLTDDGGARPLFTDPLLFAGLTAGDYYLAVSAGQNVPTDNPNEQPGVNGVFDPNVSHSGFNGTTTGAYVLNVSVRPALPSPSVVAVTPADGSTLDAPPTQLVVTFDSPVNVAQLASQAFDRTTDSTVSGVFVVGADGQRYFPRLVSYDSTTNIAVFLMLDRLPSGVNELHLSGSTGLAGLGGNPLRGSDPDDPAGDYVVSFTVAGDPSAGTDPLVRTEQAPNDSADEAQDLGVLFPRELHDGVTVEGSLSQDRPDVDVFTIEVLQDQEYHFTLRGKSADSPDPTVAPAGIALTITTASGTVVEPLPQDDPNAIFAQLTPGKYLIYIGSADPSNPASGEYQIRITLAGINENPPPLTVGGSPALRIRLGTSAPPTPPVNPPPVTVVTIPGNPGNDGFVSTQPNPSGTGGGQVTASAATPQTTQGLRGDLFGGVFLFSADGGPLATPQFQVSGLNGTVPVRQASLFGSVLLTIFTQSGGPTLLTVGGGDEVSSVREGSWQWLLDQLFRPRGGQPAPSATSPLHGAGEKEEDSPELTSAFLSPGPTAFLPEESWAEVMDQCPGDDSDTLASVPGSSRGRDSEWLGGLAALGTLGQFAPGRDREDRPRRRPRGSWNEGAFQ